MYDFAWMTEKADGSVALAELYVLPFNDAWGSATESMLSVSFLFQDLVTDICKKTSVVNSPS